MHTVVAQQTVHNVKNVFFFSRTFFPMLCRSSDRSPEDTWIEICLAFEVLFYIATVRRENNDRREQYEMNKR